MRSLYLSLPALTKAMATVGISASILGFSVQANAGFLDSIAEAQNTISSIGRTAETIRGSTQAVYGLSEEMGFRDSAATEELVDVAQLEAGAVLSGKLQRTKIYAQADKSSNPIAVLSKEDIMIYMGSEQNGYYHVESDNGAGWVSKPLVSVQ